MHPWQPLGMQLEMGGLVTPARGLRSTLVSVTTHLPPAVADELRQAAEARGLSQSAAAAVLLTEALRADVEHKHGSLIEAAVQGAIRRELGRIGELTARSALDTDETRRLVYHLLVKAEGLDRGRAIRREAHSAAYQRLSEPLAAALPTTNGHADRREGSV
jgi:hypothetical protein